MKKLFKLIIPVFILFLSGKHYSQSLIECGTPERDEADFEALPWFGNNNYLFNLLDSFGYNGPQPKIAQPGPFDVVPATFRIPIKFWVYRDNNGNGGFTLEEIQAELDSLNSLHRQNNTRIHFYQTCNIGYIDNDNYFDISSDSDQKDIIRDNHDKGVINVHLVRSGLSGVFWQLLFKKGVIISQKPNSGPATLSHEIGHYLGLNHTHQYHLKGKCRKEPIDHSRTWAFINFCGGSAGTSKCSTTGDALCDTPADPKLADSQQHYVDNDVDCNYNGIFQDSYGDSYHNPPSGSFPPDARNIMSYSLPLCKDHFSLGQLGVMVSKIVNSSDFCGWYVNCHPVGIVNRRYHFDIYEPDNSSVSAREIIFNTPQHHTFHWVYKKNTKEDCDEDWVQFTVSAPQSGLIEITTSEAYFSNPNTEIWLFDASLNQIAYDDNGNGNLYSKIIIDGLSPGTYFVKIKHITALPEWDGSDYILEVKQCAPYDNFVTGVVNTGETRQYLATHDIIAAGGGDVFEVNSGADVTLKAQHQIYLLPGFNAKPGSNFLAFTGTVTCDDENYTGGKLSDPGNETTPINTAKITEEQEDIEENDNDKFEKYTIARPTIAALPNPFKVNVVFEYKLEQDGPVELFVSNIQGKKIEALVNETNKPAGRHLYLYYASHLKPGIYLYTLKTKDHSITKRLVVLK